MISDNPVLTVEEIYKQALPLGTTIIAAGDAQSRPVHWVVAMEADAQVPYLEGGELVVTEGQVQITNGSRVSARETKAGS